MKYLYLLLNIAAVFFPFALSFDKKVAFYKKWKALFPAIFIVGLFFATWDYFFTKWGVWQFNEDYILGIYLLGLPLEEWLFFITVPYAVVFIYEVIKVYSGREIYSKAGRIFAVSSAVLLAFTGFIYFDKVYTAFTFLLCAVLLLINGFLLKHRFPGIFFIAYFIQLVPFFIINGVLTSMPVVVYNDLENMGVRIFSIPLEDAAYSLLLLLMNVTLFEAFNTLLAGKKTTLDTWRTEIKF